MGMDVARHAARPKSRLRDFRPDIEGLRFFLILMVVLHHLTVLVGGKSTNLPVFGGVDASIALSGFLGATIVLREITTTGRLAFGKFYARRARRLLPLATIVTVATVIVAVVALPVYRLHDITVDALSTAGFVMNFRLALQHTDYAAGLAQDVSSVSPLQHNWSLAVEEQFWLVLPVFLVMVMWLIRKFRLGMWPLAGSLVALTAGSLYLSVVITESAQSWAYFGTHTRIWEFGMGALTAVSAQAFSRMWQSLAAVMSWAGLALLFGGSYFIAQTPAIPGWVMIWPVLGTCLFIAGGCAAPKYGAEALVALTPFRFFGRASYGWYLWHWPMLLILPVAFGYRRELKYDVLVSLASLALAVGTYYAVERPFKAWKSLVDQPSRGLAMGRRLALVSASVALIVLTAVTVQGSATTQAPAYADSKTVYVTVAESAQVNNLSAAAEKQMTSVKRQMFGHCLNDIKTTKAQPCFLGDAGGEKLLVLLGSSLAWQWIPAFDRITRDAHMRLVVFTKGSCPAQPYSVETQDYMHKAGLTGTYSECDDWRKDAYQQIDGLHPNFVVMSSRMEQASNPDAIRSGVSYFRDRGAKVVQLGETPGFADGDDMPACVSGHIRTLQVCLRPLDQLVDRHKAEEASRAALEAGAVTIDPLPWLCTRVCPPVIGDIPVYKDTRHMSVAYVISLTRVLREQLPLE